MLLTAADRWSLEPGEVTTWRVAPSPRARLAPAPLTLNQRNHVRAAAVAGQAVWMAAVVHLPGRVEVLQARAAVAAVLGRHPSLRTAGLPGPDGEIEGVTVPAGSLDLLADPVWREDDGRATAARLAGVLDDRCRPGRLLSVSAAVVQREHSSTVVLAFDHQHGDAHSVAHIVHELHGALSGHATATAPTHPARDREVDLEAAETRQAIAVWERQVAGHGHTAPVFPLPLGLEPGQSAPQRTVVQPLLGQPATAGLAQAAHRAGLSTFGLLLSGLAAAVDDTAAQLGVQRRSEGLYVLVPVSTRTPDDEGAVGWFTTTVPVSLPGPAGGGEGLPPAGAVAEQLRAARAMAAVPLTVGLAGLTRPLVLPRRDLFMLSYVDYTRLPGGGDLPAEHVSASTVADDVQLWVARTAGGLAVRARVPDTPQARASTSALLSAWTARLDAESASSMSGPVGRLVAAS